MSTSFHEMIAIQSLPSTFQALKLSNPPKWWGFGLSEASEHSLEGVNLFEGFKEAVVDVGVVLLDGYIDAKLATVYADGCSVIVLFTVCKEVKALVCALSTKCSAIPSEVTVSIGYKFVCKGSAKFHNTFSFRY
jgi:hypothetical protein